MKKMFLMFFVMLSLCVFANAQSTVNNQSQSSQTTQSKPKKSVFRANKDQIMQAQKILKLSETGKLSKADKIVLKNYQKENGLRTSGSLNRATLEKLGIALTNKQTEIPVNPKDFAQVGTSEKAKRGPVFKATKDQVMEAQKMLKVNETGKLSKEDREALKKYQTDNGLKATGTLNKITLEKMGIELTEKQKVM